MSKIEGQGFNPFTEKLNAPAKVDRSNTNVPAPPAENSAADDKPAFSPKNNNNVKNFKEGTAPKTLELCSFEPDEPGIYQCLSKTEPDGKDEPKIFKCTAKIDPDEKFEPKIFKCTAKIDPEELKEKLKKHDKPEIYNCTYKMDPAKKDDQPQIYSCTYKTDGNDKKDKPEIYSCTYKMNLD